MTKQEEIREGIERIILEQLSDDSPWQSKVQLAKAITKGILTFQDSQGVVIKVDRELPKCLFSKIAVKPYPLSDKVEMPECSVEKAGYVAVVPLIGGEDET